MAEHFDQNILFAIEMIIGVYDLVVENSFLFILFKLSDFHQKASNILDELSEIEHGRIVNVTRKFS